MRLKHRILRYLCILILPFVTMTLVSMGQTQNSSGEFVYTFCNGKCSNIAWDNRTFDSNLYNNPQHKQILVHTRTGDHIGSISFGTSDIKNKYTPCNVHWLRVHNAYQKKGLGKELLHRAMINMVKENGCTSFNWLSSHEAVGFYKKLGAEFNNVRATYDFQKNGPIIKETK